MALQAECSFDERRKLLRESNGAGTTNINGIDYLEVIPPTSVLEPPLILVFCLLSLQASNPIPPPPKTNLLNGNNVVISGGTRIRKIGIQWALPVQWSLPITPGTLPGVSGPQLDDLNEELEASGVSDLSTVLVVRPTSDGDFSTYTLQLVSSTDPDSPPTGFDPVLSKIGFGFKVECPTDFDCLAPKVCPPAVLPEPVIDYMSKDYESFRTLMLDRLALLIPDWTERHPADMGVALVELLAYVGDQLSYYQDAVATEAYLGTARQRVSIRRHARLLDYFMHDGCNARAWVVMDAGAGYDAVLVPGGTVLLTGGAGDATVVKPTDLQAALAGAEAFQTMYDVTLYGSKNEVRLYAWGDPECCLPAGATEATLNNENNALDTAGIFNWTTADSTTDAGKLLTFLAQSYALEWLVQASLSFEAGEPGVTVEWSPDPAFPPKTELVISYNEHHATIRLGADGLTADTNLDGNQADEFVIDPTTKVARAHTIRKGDILIFEEIRSPTTGARADADPTHRAAVRLTKVSADQDELGNIATGGEQAIAADTPPVPPTSLLEVEWDEADAIPFPLCLQGVRDPVSGDFQPVTVARGNVVLADHGIAMYTSTFSDYNNSSPSAPYSPPDGVTAFTEFIGLTPTVTQPQGADESCPGTACDGPAQPQIQFRPELQDGPLTQSAPFDQSKPAASAFDYTPQQAMPQIVVLGEGDVWLAARDLLSSNQFDQEFVVETNNDGTALLRFGDNDYGQAPRPSTQQDPNPFFAIYRVGNGTEGNVGREAISRVVASTGLPSGVEGLPAWLAPRLFSGQGITKVRNPMEAQGGADPESMEDVRQFAPQAFRVQQRAVTPDDYEAVLLKFPGISKAFAERKWTGSWWTYFISVDRVGGQPVDEAFKKAVLGFLDGYRLAGYDLEITNPIYAPLDISMHVCLADGFFKGDVERRLLDAFSNRILPDGTKGFFHPDSFTFGQPVYLSQVYERALTVAGVSSVEISEADGRFQRWGRDPAESAVNIVNGVIQIAPSEIARLDNDPDFEENGIIDFIIDGGSQ